MKKRLLKISVLVSTALFFATAQLVWGQFVPPSQTAPGGSGTLRVDSNYNVGLGTSSASITPSGGVSFGRLFTISSSSNPGFSLLTGTNRYAWYADTASGTLSLAGSTNGSGGNRISQITPGGTVYGYDYHSINNQNYYVDPGMSLMPYSALFSGSVGIGTTGPTSIVQINGNEGAPSTSGNMNNGLIISHTMAGPALNIGVQNIGVGTSYAWLTSAYANNAGVYNYLVLQPNGGNVGIGTTSPAYLLDVNGSARVATSLYSTGNLNLYGTLGGTVSLYTGPGGGSYTENLRVTPQGNVGIGTTGPGYKLEVNGNARVDTDLYLLNTVLNPASGYSNQKGAGFNSATGAFEIAANNVSPLTVGRYGGVGSLINFRYAGITMGDLSTDGTNLSIMPAGNVGIGTTTPTTAGLVVSTNVSGAGIDVNNNRIINVGTPLNANDAATMSYVQSVIGTGGGGTSTGSFATLSVTGTTTLATNGTSFVGIGTASPTAKLEVAGNAIIRGTSIFNKATAPTTVAGYVGAGGNINAPVGFYDVLDISGNGGIVFDGSPTGAWRTDIFVASSTGYVGIGTSTPGTNLDVNGNINVGSILYDRANTNYYLNPSGNIMPYALNTGGGINVGGSGTFSGSLAVNGANVTLSNATQLVINSTSSSAIQMNQGSITGVYKLSVNTVDPVYDVGGVNYATYAPDVIGIKTETFGKLALSSSSKYQVLSSEYGGGTKYSIPNTLYSATIDFNKVERGSDLWLFWQTINEGKDMKDISVYLTPNFDGQTWYELNPTQKQIAIYAIPDTKYQIQNTNYEVSYHLVAPRYDSEKWGNYAPSGEAGVSLPVKTYGDNTAL